MSNNRPSLAPSENSAVEESNWPEGYVMRREGLYFLSDTERLLCQPFEVLGAGLAPEGGQAIAIAFRDAGGEEQKALIAKANLVGGGHQILRQLIGAGFSIEFDENCWRLLQLFFLRLRPSRSCDIVTRPGWVGHCFVLPERVIGCEEKAIFYTGAAPVPQARSRGTLQQWQEQVAYRCLGNSRIIFALSLGFAAPLLPLVGVEPAVFHFVGPGSCGKTTLLQCAASLSGPASNLSSWQTSAAGLQATARDHHHQLMILDDFGQLPPRQVRSMISQLTSGRASPRARADGRVREAQQWQTLILSAGPIAVGEFSRSDGAAAFAGLRAHLIDIPAQAREGFGVFEELHGHANAGEFAEYLLRKTQNDYGTAFPAYLEALCRADHEALIEAYRRSEKRFLQRVLPEQAQGELRRIARRFFLVGYAGELAIDYQITPWPKGHAMGAAYHLFKIWHQQFAGMANLDAGEILDQVRTFLETHHHRFMVLGAGAGAKEQKAIPRNLAGYCMNKAGREHHFIKAPVFTREVLKGLDRTCAIEVLRHAGILIPHPGTGEASQSKRLPKGHCAAQRVYHLVDALYDRDAQAEREEHKDELKKLFGSPSCREN